MSPSYSPKRTQTLKNQVYTLTF